MTMLFWVALALVAYVYVGYPLLMAAWAAIRPRPWLRSGAPLPAVSIVIAAKNEAARLPGGSRTCSASTIPPTGSRSSLSRTDRPIAPRR